MTSKKKQQKIEEALRELQKIVKSLKRYGRSKDIGRNHSILANEYISLERHFEDNYVPNVYKIKEFNLLLTRVQDHIDQSKGLIDRYEEIERLKEVIESEFNIYEKSTLIFQEMNDALKKMEMYLNFDRFEDYERIKSYFKKQKENLEELPSKGSNFLINRLAKIKNKLSKIRSEKVREEKWKKIEMLENLQVENLPDYRDEIFDLQKKVDEILNAEYQDNIRNNVLSLVQKRLNNGSDISIGKTEDFAESLRAIKSQIIKKG
jgi:hypothetical protein